MRHHACFIMLGAHSTLLQLPFLYMSQQSLALAYALGLANGSLASGGPGKAGRLSWCNMTRQGCNVMWCGRRGQRAGRRCHC